MINFRLLFSRLVLLFLLFIANNELKAHEFGTNDWDVSYNTCDGYIEVNLLYFNKDGVNDWMDYIYFDFKRTNGDYQQFFFWEHESYTCNLCTLTDVTDGETFHYGFNYGSAQTTWSYFYVSGSGEDLVKMKVRFYGLPSDLIGTDITVRINGLWHGGGGDSDVNISNWEKSASSTSINAPTGLMATVDEHCDKVRISWTNPASNPCFGDDWKVYVYRDNAYIGNGGKTGFYDDFGAVKGTTYSYKVRALFEPNAYIDNYSAYTDPPMDGRRTGPLDPPTNVTASTDRCDGKILVQWQWPGTNPENFLIERSTSANSGFSVLSNTLAGSTRSYLDMSSVNPNINYYYRLKAKNVCGDWSTTYSATINPPGNAAGIPTEPSGVTATADTNKIKVMWTDNTSIENGFILERTFLGGGAALLIEVPANTTSYTDLDVNLCVTYTYKVKAKSPCYPTGNGTQKASAMLTPMLQHTFDSNALQASKGYFADKIQLEWTNNNSNVINKFKIYRKILGSPDPFTQIASENSGTNLYIDQFSEAGVLYEYRIQAEGLCENTTVYSNTSEAIGFRTKTGTVTGQVTYSGGIAVNNVKITAENTSGFNGKSLLFAGGNLSIPHQANLAMGSQLLLETWIKPTSHAANFIIIEKANSYCLKYIKAPNQYRFTIYEAGGVTTNLNISGSIISLNNYNHIAAQLTSDSMQIFVNGVWAASKKIPAAFLPVVDLDDPAVDITIGNGLQGNLDELRIWNKSKSIQGMLQDHARLMTGGEQGLIVYLRMNECVGTYAYDGSKNGSLFNKNHAAFNGMVSWSDVVPSVSQLSASGYTDAAGNYIIVIPYNGPGEVFILTPSYLTHEFNPSTTGLFIGDGASVHNNVNFTDKSSFRVQGSLIYKETTCGVPDAFIKVDGEILIVNGVAAKTDAIGAFDVQVPIGEHFIEVEQPGHVYAVKRFPATGKYDFQEDLAGISFIDSTLVKVVGRVAGGLREGSKIPGLGKSKNNIGVAEVILKSQQGNGCSTDTIYTDPATGEYTVWLPPLRYVPSVKIVNNPAINFGVLSLVDLSGTPVLFTKYDTTFNTQGGVVSIDSVQFNKQLDYIHRVNPQIAVYDRDGLSPFIGDTIYTHHNPVTNVTTTVNLKTDPFRWPVFHQQAPDYLYRCLIKVFESYTNFDMMPNVIDSVPTTDGTLKFNNELSDVPNVEVELASVNTLDTLKTLIYSFKPGFPNFLENLSIPEYSYTRKLEINLVTSNGTAIPWLPVPVPQIPVGGDAVYRAYLLGTQSNGAQFVTFGPQVPEYILRDPPGSASMATREVGSTKTEKSTWKWNLGTAVHTKDAILVGAKFTAGFGVLIETDIQSNISAGFKAEIGGGTNGSQSVTTTNTREWSTYGGTVISPGANSDLYIGKSKNLQFGVAEELAIIPDGLCTNVECIGGMAAQPGGMFSFAKKYGLSVVPGGYETQFMFNEYDVKYLIIPNLYKLRNLMLQTNSKYMSKLPIGHENYGKNNDDPAFGALATSTTPYTGDFADLDGPSYQYMATTIQDTLTDSVRILNHQIMLWENAIRLNEWEKVNINNQTAIDSLKQVELDNLDSLYSGVKAAYIALIVANGIGGVVVAYGLIATPVPGVAFAGYITFAVMTGTGIALAELFEEYQTYLAKKQRIEEKFAAMGASTNYTLSGGTNIKSSMSHQTASAYNGTLEYAMTANFLAEVEGKVSNNGVKFEKGVEMKFTSGREWGQEEDSTETVSFELNDPDIGDLFSVDVYPSLLGWGPVFKVKPGGQTSCPHEAATLTEYYNPGTEISARTLQIDKPTISASPTIQTNIPVDEAAVFNLTLGNESENGFIMGYTLDVVGASNPFGAIVLIDGFPLQNLVIPAGTAINKVLTIEKGPGPVYNYDNILVTIHSQCQYTGGAGFNTDIVDSVYLSAHFLPTCSKTAMALPEDQWVLNNSFHDTMPVAIIDYNINFFDLENIRLDYKPSSSPNWIAIETFHKDTSGLNDPSAKPIPQNTPFTLYDWDVSQLTDGAYDLRIVSNCELAEKASATHSGVIDRINPHAFGHPSPADGILSPNDEISIKFNEPIDLGSINPAIHFDIRGVTNGTDVDHSTSLSFDGVDDCLSINGGIPLDNRDFTIELSIKRDGLGQMVIFSQGVDVNERISLSFDANNKLVFTINNSTVTSTTAITDNNWHFIALSYNYKTETAQMYLADAVTTATVINNGATSILAKYTGNSHAMIGKNTVTTQAAYPFKGNIHELRIWNRARTLSEFSVFKSKLLTGTEAGLLHNWRMDEAFGNLAIEHLKRRDALITGATWQITPSGSAANFSPANAHLKVNTQNIAITDDMDFTLEFWFRSSNSNQTVCLFSNGTGNGLQSDSLISWNIIKDPAGILRVQHNKLDLPLTTKNYFDGSWHHFALVMHRVGNLSTYIDGEFESSYLATNFRQLSGANMYIGARGYTIAQSETIGNYYKGRIDEFRFWNLARMVEQIKRDKQNRMMGDELGLELYLPFEAYSEDPSGIPILTPTFTDQAAVPHAVTPNTTNLANNTPTIKIQRPVQQIAFDFSVNNDQIILTPTTAPELIENVTLDITVEGIKDLHGNVMESPVTWIAYIDKNQVVWQDQLFNFSILKGESLEFNSAILNRGGAVKKFDIVDIPSWLTVTPTTGSIAPNSIVPVTFKVDPNINLGQYNINVGLLTDFNYKEKLAIDLNVKAKDPDWVVDPTVYEHNMTIIGQVKINGVFSADVNDKLVAFVGQQVRGVAHVEYVPQIAGYRVFLNVYSNTATGEALTFRVWDASAGKIYTDVTVVPANLTFDASALVGTLIDPKIFQTNANVSYEFPLKKGWSWLSFFLNNPVPTDLNNILASVSQTGAQIKNRDQFANFSLGVWSGSLNSGASPYGIKPESMYKLNLASSNDTLVLKGTVVNPTLVKMNLSNGWTWIGFISIRQQSVTQALGGLNASIGDLIKGKTNFAVYNGPSLGWIGSLKTMIPGEGYMYKSNGIKSFYYPIAGMFDNFTDLTVRTDEDAYWEVEHGVFNSNMTIIGELKHPCKEEFSDGRYGIGLKDASGHWRGKAPFEELQSKDYGFLTVAGDDQEMLDVYLIDRKTDVEYKLDLKIPFEVNASLGEMDYPFEFKIPQSICEKLSTEENEDRFVVYPHVFEDVINVEYNATIDDPNAILKITNMDGKAIFLKQVAIHKGFNHHKLDLKKLNLPPAAYVIELISADKHKSQKIFRAY
ncbi:MAG: hypothetical protein IPM34_05340 [Saprospiraceae bacterium]|nr:hypothetical protein [Saprospiraceae bacterium]